MSSRQGCGSEYNVLPSSTKLDIDKLKKDTDAEECL